MSLRLTRNMLAWCCFWLLLTPFLSAPPERLPIGADRAASVIASGGTSDNALRPRHAEFIVRTAPRDGPPGNGGTGRKALIAASFDLLEGPTALATGPTPRAISSPRDFLTSRTAHPRAPPA